MKIAGVFLVLVTAVAGRKGFGPGEQEWGYSKVREGAHIFWWLHQTTANVTSHLERPLVIWLQGGPGASGTGYGNFAELGPYDADLNPRNTTWLSDVNVMFVDNPVGTGWSYVDSDTLLVKTNREIADDFLVFIRDFYNTLPEYRSVPMYIFGESYGGKMAPEIGLVLYQAVQAGTLAADFRGVGLGDSWISPVDYVLTYGAYLLNVGAVDQGDYEQIEEMAERFKESIDEGNYHKASELYGTLTDAVLHNTYNIDFYNILTKAQVGKPVDFDPGHKIHRIMNDLVKPALGLQREWNASAPSVHKALIDDTMRPVTSVVEQLLNETTLKVAVYNGQLDLIVDTPGTVAWVDRLQSLQSNRWAAVPRGAILVDNVVEGYVKRLGNFALYWVNRAGHMVPADNPAVMWKILFDMTDGFSVAKNSACTVHIK